MADDTTGHDVAHVEAILRDVDVHERPVRPPESVWDGVVARLEVAAVGPIVDLADRRRRRSAAVLLSVAAAAVVAIVVGVTVVDRSGDGVLARADLAHEVGFDPLGAEAAAAAELVDAATIRLTGTDLPDDLAEPADLEVWLIETDPAGEIVDLVSLGVVGDTAEFSIPAGYDPAVYSVVDISVEPRDGVAAHSGRSILRGPLLDA